LLSPAGQTADTASGPPAPARVGAADLGAELRRFEGAGLVEAGKLCVIGFGAVRQALGPRWPGRSEQVHAHVERVLGSHVGPAGWVARVAEGEYVAVRPDLDRYALQALCLRASREILTHFLGEARPWDFDIREVTEFFGKRLTTRRLHFDALDACDPPPAALDVVPGDLPPPLVTDPANPDHWSPFASTAGRPLRVSSTLEPLFELKSFRQIGHRLTRRVTEIPSGRRLSEAEIRRLSRRDIERIDFATVSRGVSRARAESADRQPTLMLPVSYLTLAGRRGAAQTVEFLRQASAFVSKGLICEITDVEGVPPSALSDAVALVKPFSFVVVGRLDAPDAGGAAPMKHVGLTGLGLDCAGAPDDQAAFADWAVRRVELMLKSAKAALLHGLPDMRLAAVAALAGATHASLRSREPAPRT
jgi:hypothetical protein